MYTRMQQIGGVLMFVAAVVSLGAAAKRGKCNACLENGVACLAEDQFAPCYLGTPTDSLVRCPSGRVCTEHASICMATVDGHEAACYEDHCGTCEFTNGRFACMDETHYGFCYGGIEPNLATIRACPAGYVCDYNSPQICASGQTALPSCTPRNSIPTTTTDATTADTPPPTSTTDATTADTPQPTTTTDATTADTPQPTTTTDATTADIPQPTTTTEVTSTTNRQPSTPQQPFDPNAFCHARQDVGNFKEPNDTTCKEYIYCFRLAGQYLGTRLICAGYFNDATAKCQHKRPSGC